MHGEWGPEEGRSLTSVGAVVPVLTASNLFLLTRLTNFESGHNPVRPINSIASMVALPEDPRWRGLAAAYHHHECEGQVIHWNVKSSNVMLEENFHLNLQDFDLARQVDHDRSSNATITAGTMSYLAQKYFFTGCTSDKTDVFSFVTLVLEVVSSRRATKKMECHEPC
ncbi:L-type lectin-domain containing receptor kinase VIII.1 [Platanthera guangdongensis]|uniref:L-type lectin-domain containing receptor kinase VIII.1 n=1 Tax=Platanthera guangdongensis TaxID=2320717 RepID=A0ABR2LTU6_9ASPA